MWPNQKAVELVKTFAIGGWGKENATEAVDEIIKAIRTTTGHCDLRYLDRLEVESDIDYWNEVKQEIEKL